MRSPFAIAWERVFAFGYDLFLLLSERGGLAATRKQLLSRSRGRTLEIGAGTGLNVGLYPPTVTHLVVTDATKPMLRRLERRVRTRGTSADALLAPAERLPFPDASFDTVVATFVLCSVASLADSLREIDRVLAPGGRFLFLEHVRSSDPRRARWQDRLARPWRAFACGCRCNQETLPAIAAAMAVECAAPYVVPRAPPLVSSAVVGVAAPRLRPSA
jgi:ubiquinone/menaquinone biosynthesis C-methylase UbiE